jgi:hypothetical protein
MYEPAGSEHGSYGDLGNPVERRRWRSDRDLPLARGAEQRGGSRSASAGQRHGGRQTGPVVISALVELAVDLDVRPPDGRSGTASTLD